MFLDRRSIRRFKDDEVEQAKLEIVLETARWAPSWGNTQCCEVVVVRNAELKKKLSGLLSPKNPATLAVERAPVVLAVCGGLNKAGFYSGKALTKFGDWFMYDLGLATQNICLSAHEQGLGTVIVGAFDHDGVARLLEVPENYEVVALLPLGYPDHSPSPPKRKSLDNFIHNDTFSS